MRAGESPPRIGVVVHPTREIEAELAALRGWAEERVGEIVQVGDQEREVAQRARVDGCDVVLTLGGDGTMLSGIRAASATKSPVLGIACGSLGVLTTIGVDDLPEALDRFFAGDWVARTIPALEVERRDGGSLAALNDVSLIRSGEGQLTTEATVDGALYARVVGDGFVVSTPIGSSAYTLAAGGPLLAPGTDAFVFTPLPSHCGSVPPLVVGARSTLELEVDLGHGGARLEVDGDTVRARPESLRVRLRPEMATLVTFDDAEALLTGLRRRRIIMDSPRVLARDDA
jgi:NAD+ kinase